MKTERELNTIISRMTLEQKVGAVLTLGFNGTIPTPTIFDYITKYHCGGLRLTPHSRTFSSYIDPQSGEMVVQIAEQQYYYKNDVRPPELTAQEYNEVLDDLQQLAKKRPSGIPLFFSCDQEGDGPEANGAFKHVKLFPKPMNLRSTHDPKWAYEAAKATARQLRAIGFNFLHSPVLDVNVDPRNPEIYNRAYSDKAEEVAEWAIAACRGYKEGGLIATGKHFPGRGDSPVDAHYQVPQINVDRETLLTRELLPYRELIQRDLLPAIMLAHGIYPAIDAEHIATVSKKVVTGLLRDELHFDGVITTDSMTMGGIASRYGVPQACAMALAAGADLVLMKAQNSLVDDTFAEIIRWLEDGRISETELDARLLRVLKLKDAYGIFEEPSTTEADVEAVLRDRDIIELAAAVARKSLTVIREAPAALPLAKDGKMLVVEQLFTNANNIYFQPGSLFFSCLKYNRELAYLEIGFNADEEDVEKLRRVSAHYDTLVMTNFYARSQGANTELIEELTGSGKQIIVITNTPYAFSIPETAQTVLMTGYTPETMQAAAAYLFGEGPAEGVIPVSNGVEPQMNTWVMG